MKIHNFFNGNSYLRSNSTFKPINTYVKWIFGFIWPKRMSGNIVPCRIGVHSAISWLGFQELKNRNELRT